MLRFLFTNQQRSFHQSATRWSYTRTALRRLKKPELVALAGRHKLDSSGTKNEIIDRLLISPTESNPSTTQTTLDKDSTDSSSSTYSEKSAPVQPIINTTPTTIKPDQSKPTVEMSNSETLFSSSTTTTPSSSTSTATLLADNIKDNDEEFDQQWVEAFDLKVGNRRSGLNGPGGRERSASASSIFNKRRSQSASPTTSASTSTITSAPIAASSSTHPAYVHQTLGVDPAANPNFISLSSHRPTVEDEPLEFTDPEINQHWVKVFDQRVKTRTKIMGLDTLDVNPNMTSSASLSSKNQQQPSPSPSPSPSIEGNASSTTGNNKTIDIAIGTSLAAWYILGGEGIQSAFSSFFS